MEQRSVNEGDILAGKYRVERVIGRGGMGVVVAARHEQLGQKVALKFLLPELLESREVGARFLREAQSAVRIPSEHVVRVLDIGTLENGSPFIVMEFLEGKDLGQVLEQCGRLPLTEAIDYVIQASHAVSEAHRLGIVHRDLKPPNLFLTSHTDGSPCVKILDFGIAKANTAMPGVSQANMTMADAMLGSPAYMSPEQIQNGAAVDARSDVWAMGVTLFEMLTGETPFQGATVHEFLWAIMTGVPTPLREKLPDAPPALDAFFEHCFQKDPNARIQSIADLVAALIPFGAATSKPLAERIIRGSLTSGSRHASAGALTLSEDNPGALAAWSESQRGSAGKASLTAVAWGDTQRLARRSALHLAVTLTALGIALLGCIAFFAVRRAPVDTPAASSAPTGATLPKQASPPLPSAPVVEPAQHAEEASGQVAQPPAVSSQTGQAKPADGAQKPTSISRKREPAAPLPSPRFDDPLDGRF